MLIEAFNTEKTYKGIKQFDCEHPLINNFVSKNYLKQNTKKNYHRCFVVSDENQHFAAFYTLQACSVEKDNFCKLYNSSLPRELPCLKIGMLGVDKNHKRKGLGSILILDAVHRMRKVSEHCGVFGIYLDADQNPATIDFYMKNKFEPLTDIQIDTTTPMFLPFL